MSKTKDSFTGTVTSKVMAKNWNRLIANVVENDLDEDKMLLPHVIVTRGSRMLPKTTFSLLKGFGVW